MRNWRNSDAEILSLDEAEISRYLVYIYHSLHLAIVASAELHAKSNSAAALPTARPVSNKKLLFGIHSARPRILPQVTYDGK
jgi:hypothetical protein